MKRHKFTLIEMVITIATIGVLGILFLGFVGGTHNGMLSPYFG